MTIASPIPLIHQQHIVLEDVSWSFYEAVLAEIGNRQLRVTFSDGSIEIMAPLNEHEWGKKTIARLIELMAYELGIPIECYGSSTFRREEKQKGLEPDECYYVQNASRAREIKEFDPHVHPAPDLAIEIDITRRSIPRQPIYAALGVPELWRYDGKRIFVLLLNSAGAYEPAESSAAFPFLPMTGFETFVHRMRNEDQISVLREYRDWLGSLRR